MNYGRTPNILHHVTEDLFHVAPVPIVFHQLKRDDLQSWHGNLVDDARRAFPEPVLEVPDVRHINDMGFPTTFADATWSEEQIPAVGVWHSVPTNGFLNLETPAVGALTKLIRERYMNALGLLGVDTSRLASWISESWIQFYKPGDYKVLHNHERYGPPYPDHRWAGSYCIDDGDPDPTMPYSGIFSFRIRQANYFIRPRPSLLVMWPADILHEVHPFYGTKERIVVNFNINTKSLG